MERQKYVLVRWPESQDYMERDDVFLCEDVEKAGCSAYFVPIEALDQSKE